MSRNSTTQRDVTFDGGAERAKSVEAVRDAYRDARTRAPLADEGERGEFLLQNTLYASLLQVASIWCEAGSGFRALQRIEAFEEFVDWMATDLGVIVGPVLKVAFDRFVGPQQGNVVGYVDKLLKLGADPLHDLWGAAWDLTHLSMLDQTVDPALLETEDRQVVLLTDDRALPRLRSRFQVGAILKYEDREYTLVGHDDRVDSRLSSHAGRVNQIAERLLGLAQSRVPTPPDLRAVAGLIARGEARLRAAR